MTSSQRRSWVLLLGAQLVVSAVLAAILFVGRGWVLSDVTLYYQWSDRVLAGEIPYRDFFFDYPPLALPTILAPRLLSGFQPITYGTYIVLFAGSMAALSVGLAVVIRRTLRGSGPDREGEAFRRHLVLMAVALPLLLVRYDLWPILLTALALLAVVDGRPAMSGAWLGVGIAAKLYPVALAPAFAVYWWSQRGAGPTVRHVLAVVGTAVVSLLPFVLVAGEATLDTATFQQARGLQIETAAGGLLQFANVVAPENLRIVRVTTHELQSARVDGFLGLQGWIAFVVMAATVAAAGWQLWRARTSTDLTRVLAAVSVAILIAFMLTNRALSPQHVLWAVAFAAILRPRQHLALAATVVLTLLVFPVLYQGLVEQDVLPILTLNARNAVLAGLGVWLLASPTAKPSRT